MGRNDEKKRKRRDSERLASSFGYSNDSNPFGDSNLTEKFVWKKKDGDKRRESRDELVDEIRKVRQRRDMRQEEREEMERLKREEMRLRDATEYDDWQRKEEEFHLNQATLRCRIRLCQGRGRPIDRLAKNILLFGDSNDRSIAHVNKSSMAKEYEKQLDAQIELEIDEPIDLIESLDKTQEIEELLDEIRDFRQLEEQFGSQHEYWQLLEIICRNVSKESQNSTIHSAVDGDIKAMFQGQSLTELNDMNKEIQQTLDQQLDREYWEGVLNALKVAIAKAELKQIHEKMLKRQKERLESRPVVSDPVIVPVLVDEKRSLDSSREAIAMQQMEQEKGMDEEEEEYDASNEMETKDITYEWSNKYRPRKPRYFNRVKAGYDWNKYNMTHYDEENPPPKTIQGYKFNLFYPDLIDKTTTPRFYLEKAESPEFAILRFHAGPPYQDIAFKIVNQEWDQAQRRGFKSVFERGVLHLYFNFKRHRYRR